MKDLEEKVESTPKERSLFSLVKSSLAKTAAIAGLVASLGAMTALYGCGNGNPSGNARCGPCSSDGDCTSGCCSANGYDAGVCSGQVKQNYNGTYDYDYCYPSSGCGFHK